MSNNFEKIGSMSVDKLAKELAAHPELWDKNPCRLSKLGPHRESHDIVIRYKDETPCLQNAELWKAFSEPHFAEWYRSVDFLPEAGRIATMFFGGMGGEHLGGVLIYKLQPGEKIYPHVDKGWHAEFYDKYNICIQSNKDAAFVYDEDRMVQCAGEVHHFRNDVTHSVVNEGDCDHIVMTVCIRLDSQYRVPWSPEGWTIDKQFGR